MSSHGIEKPGKTTYKPKLLFLQKPAVLDTRYDVRLAPEVLQHLLMHRRLYGG